MVGFLDVLSDVLLLFRRERLDADGTCTKLRTVINVGKRLIGDDFETLLTKSVLRADRGSDYTSKAFRTCAEQELGLKLEFASVDQHGGIGHIERRWRTLGEKAVALRVSASMPPEFYFYALECVNFIHNRLAKDGQAPIAKLSNQVPDDLTIYPFGCRVSVARHSSKVRKGESRVSDDNCFVGYSSESKNSVLVYCRPTKRVTVRADNVIRVIEDEFPFAEDLQRKEFHIPDESDSEEEDRKEPISPERPFPYSVIDEESSSFEEEEVSSSESPQS